MALAITDTLKEELHKFFRKNRKADLVTTYLFFLEKKHNIHPVLFLREKTIYQSQQDLIKKLEDQGKLWRETEIKIQFGQPTVNAQTQKIYICPFTGKVFGDNTHPNPQDAIYDWVSTCPENKERSEGIRVKRFFVSEDPEIIKNYIGARKTPITKIVFSSAISGKLFNNKTAVIDDFIEHQLKPLSLVEVPAQNRFQIESRFLEFIQTHLQENQIRAFVEAITGIELLAPYTEQWTEEAQEDLSEDEEV
jgi:hypothetical protein